MPSRRATPPRRAGRHPHRRTAPPAAPRSTPSPLHAAPHAAPRPPRHHSTPAPHAAPRFASLRVRPPPPFPRSALRAFAPKHRLSAPRPCKIACRVGAELSRCRAKFGPMRRTNTCSLHIRPTPSLALRTHVLPNRRSPAGQALPARDRPACRRPGRRLRHARRRAAAARPRGRPRGGPSSPPAAPPAHARGPSRRGAFASALLHDASGYPPAAPSQELKRAVIPQHHRAQLGGKAREEHEQSERAATRRPAARLGRVASATL